MHYFEYSGTVIAEFTTIKLFGRQGLDTPHIEIDLAVTMRPSKAEPGPRVIAISSELRFENILLATSPTEFINWRCFANYSQTNNARLRFLLTPGQIRRLDELRSNNGGLQLQLAPSALIDGSYGIQPGTFRTSISHQVTASDWNRLLQEMKFEDRATFEVPINGGRVGPPLDKAAEFMREALNQVEVRHWADALIKCRDVLDELQEYQPTATPAWNDWANPTARVAWNVPERLSAMQAALRHVTHAGAHAAIGAANEYEVRLVVRMTGALLSYYASLPR